MRKKGFDNLKKCEEHQFWGPEENGSKFKIHDKYFTVIGILDYTGSIF
jgi:hypothetical protein